MGIREWAESFGPKINNLHATKMLFKASVNEVVYQRSEHVDKSVGFPLLAPELIRTEIYSCRKQLEKINNR